MLQKEIFWCFLPLSFKISWVTPWLQIEFCDLTLSKQITLIKKASWSSQKVSLIIQSSSNIIGETDIQYVQQEIKKQVAKPAKHYDNIPSKIKQEIGSYALIHETKAAIDHFSKLYGKYSLKRTTVIGWKERCNKNDLHFIGKRRRPNLVDNEILKKIADVIIGSRLASIVIGIGDVKGNKPKI